MALPRFLTAAANLLRFSLFLATDYNVSREFKTLLQINTRVWLQDFRAARHDDFLDLNAVDEAVFESWKNAGMDAAWFMGVWEPSPAGRQIASQLPWLLEEGPKILPDFDPAKDIVASPFAVRDYALNTDLGDFDTLQSIRASLHRQGMQFILDLVPNHTAVDHPWVKEHPEYYIPGTPKHQRKAPNEWFNAKTNDGKKILANGRDPKSSPWTDTAQINIFNPGARKALITVIKRLAGLCDGVRCDMAMLLLNSVFRETWGEQAPEAMPKREPAEFWEEAITTVKRDFPDFLFMAECYWDLEPKILSLGFDYCYDKRLLDRLLEGLGQEAIKAVADAKELAGRLIHFVENHDEARAVEAFGPTRSMAAAMITATLPGLFLVQEGQSEGWRVKLPMQIRRRPIEKRTRRIEFFYERLLKALRAPVMRDGNYRIFSLRAADVHLSVSPGLLAYGRELGAERRLMIANVGRGSARAYIELPASWLNGKVVRLVDELSEATEDHPAAKLQGQGLLVDLSMGGHRLWRVISE